MKAYDFKNKELGQIKLEGLIFINQIKCSLFFFRLNTKTVETSALIIVYSETRIVLEID